MGDQKIKVGMRVEVSGKGVRGTVAFIGTTQFSSGKWIGVALDEKKGKNNGSVQGRTYFTCEDNHGIFVRQTQLTILTEGGAPVPAAEEAPPPPSGGEKESTPTPTPAPSKLAAPKSGLKKPSGLAKPSAGPAGSPAAGDTPEASGPPADDKSAPSGRPPPPVGDSGKPSLLLAKWSERSAAAPAAPKVEAKRLSLSQTTAADASALLKPSPETPSTGESEMELSNLRLEVQDYREKLAILTQRRTEDKEKLKEAEKLRIHNNQLEEYKKKMQEQAADLQRQLAQAKKEKGDVEESFERYREDMTDLAETVEMATLDKEMAEEKLDSLSQEVESLKEKLEEVTLESEILKGELEESGKTVGPDGEISSLKVKQYEQQIERLKDAVVKLRDISNHEKQEAQTYSKEVQRLQTENDHLTREKQKLSEQVAKLNEQMIELKEQVDAALGSEEMVSTLTDQNLQLEEKIQGLEEEKTDLEALCEMNDELQENAREMELELREEVDLAMERQRQLVSRLETCQETIGDYECTIEKFRDLVAELQEQNRELRTKTDQQAQQAQNAAAAAALLPSAGMQGGGPMGFDFKSKFAETKALAKIIDADLRQLDVEQGNSHVRLLSSFLPESFLKRGGDHDSVLTVLLLPRLVSKAELLTCQTREKFAVPDQLESAASLEKVAGSGAEGPNLTEGISFATYLGFQMSAWRLTLRQYDWCLNSCSIELLQKVATLFPELISREEAIDHLIELLRKDQLDENANLEAVEAAIAYFATSYSVHLSHGCVEDCTKKMSDFVRVAMAASDALCVDAYRLKSHTAPSGGGEEIHSLVNNLENFFSELRSKTRGVRRRLPDQPRAQPLSFPKAVSAKLDKALSQLTGLVRAVNASSRQLGRYVGTDSSSHTVPAGNVREWLLNGIEAGMEVKSPQSLDPLRSAMAGVMQVINTVASAMEHGEYDFDGTKERKPQIPVVLRAEAYRKELVELENIRFRLEGKDEEMKELKVQQKLKQEELSEMSVRVGLVEKKLENASRESEDKIERLQQKLDQSTAQYRRKEKEFEETADALQADIDALEQERQELKEKLKVLSKKTLLEGLTRSSNAAAAASAASPTPAIGATITTASSRDANVLAHQVDVLREALSHVKLENVRLRAAEMSAKLAAMPALRPSRKPRPAGGPLAHHKEVQEVTASGDGPKTEEVGLVRLYQRSCQLLRESHVCLARPQLVDLSSGRPCKPALQLLSASARLTGLRARLDSLQREADSLLSQGPPRPAGVTTAAAGVLVGRVYVPAESGKEAVIPLNVTLRSLRQLQLQFMR